MINLVITDCDGVLTDNTVFYFDNGQRARRFNLGDGHGFQLLREAGIEVAIFSGENDQNIKDRANKLGVLFIHTKDKLKIARKLVKRKVMDLYDVAFIGNDIMDLPLLRNVGYAGCPDDAHPAVTDCIDNAWERKTYRCSKSGGDGAFREFAEYVLLKNYEAEDLEESPMF